MLGWHFKSYLQAWWACRRNGLPILCRGDSQLAGRRSLPVRALKRLVYPAFLGSFDAHLAVGSRNRDYLLHYGVDPERIGSAPHCVDNAWWRERSRLAEPSREALRRRWGVGPRVLVATFVGKLTPTKRPGDLLAAVERADGAVHAVLVGDGPLRRELERSAGARGVPATFLGFRNQTELPEIYAASDAVVLPSGRESWGLVVNEALACRRWTVVSDAAGAADDLVDEGRTGFVVPAGAVSALADRLGRLAPDSAPDRGAVDRLLGRFSVERAVAGTLEAVSRVVGGAEPGARVRR